MKNITLNKIIEAIQTYTNDDLSYYVSILRKNFSETEPIFMKNDYTSFFLDCSKIVKGWLPEVILANAYSESEGSEKLLEIWQRTNFDAGIENEILYHTKDEARHSRLFIKLLLDFNIDEISRKKINNISKNLTKIDRSKLIKVDIKTHEAHFIDEIIQINLGEIRTLVHMHFLGPVIFSLTKPERKDKTSEIIQGLANDEIIHISYAARIINNWCKDGNYIIANNIFKNRNYFFNLFTRYQTETIYNNYHNGKYPKLLEI